jgi:hypothetical protein
MIFTTSREGARRSKVCDRRSRESEGGDESLGKKISSSRLELLFDSTLVIDIA